MKVDLHELKEAGAISELDVHFGRFMERLAAPAFPGLAAVSALVSATTREGHVYLDLETLPFEDAPPGGLLKKLRRSGVVGMPGEFKPLVADKRGRLYLYRYWEYERTLAEWINGRAGEKVRVPDTRSLSGRLGRLFPASGKGAADWQAISAFVSITKSFAVISGGPGTGKTTTAAKILALLLEDAWPAPLRIALAAPTGKGAARLQSAITLSKASLQCSDQIRDALPESASTIHRLLGPVEGSPYFRHNGSNPLNLDVLLIDEASMVDLALMSKLVQALPQPSRMILLGDKDQLASVEAGAVLGDICNTGRSHTYSKRFSAGLQRATGYSVGGAESKRVPPIADCIVQLRKNYRFGSESGIAALSSAVNQGDWPCARAILDGAREDIVWRDLPSQHSLLPGLREKVLDGYGKLFYSPSMQGVSGSLDQFRILCALRQGPFGAGAVNLLVEGILKREGLIPGGGKWYAGRPILISRNDYELNLFNGDTGVTMHDSEEGGDLRVFFPTSAGSIRKVHPSRLPEHETCYATTAHKSQGSEFEKVLVILPDRDSPVLTRELIYTAVTRAKHSVEVWGNHEILKAALERCTLRRSGLRDALWGEET
jgi:exodeoxyribonuclease V alpha subunit